MSLYQKLIQLSRDWPVQLEYATGDKDCLKMCNHLHPVSIKEDEFFYIHNFILKNNLRLGYEVATGFGVSTLAAAIPLNMNGGRLITLDCYVEEKTHAKGYENRYQINGDSDGLVMARRLSNIYKTFVDFMIGWSPDDVSGCVQGYKSFDYVFIDARHYDENLLLDIGAITPFLAERFALFIHDSKCFSKDTLKTIEARFGKEFEVVVPWPQGFDLAVINRL